MANLPIISPAEFTSEIYQRQREDFITSELENEITGQLLNNDIYLKKEMEELTLTSENHGNDTEIHVTPAEKSIWNAVATQSSPGRMTAADKQKLDNMAAGAEVNQNAFGNVKVGSTVIAANSKTAQIEIAAGSNVTVTGDNASKKVTITANLPATMPPSAHNQSASTITAGTMAGQVLANASAVAAVGNKQVRNIYAGASDMTVGVTALPSGDIYVMYE